MHVAKRLQQSRSFESNFHGGGPIGLLFDPSRPPLDCAGEGDGLWRGFRQIASRRDESTGAFARARADLTARGHLYLPLIRRIYPKSEPPRTRCRSILAKRRRDWRDKAQDGGTPRAG